MSAYKCHHSHHAQVQSQKFCTLGFRQQEYCEQPNHDERPESYNIKKCIIIIIIIIIIIAGDKRSPQS